MRLPSDGLMIGRSLTMIIDHLRNAASGAWLRSGLLLTGLNLAAGGLGYVYQVLMGRLLTAADFALFSAFMALAVICSAPLNAFVLLLARRVSAFRAAEDLGRGRGLYGRVHVGMVLLGLVLAGLLVACHGPIQDYLKAPQALDLWLFGAATFVGFLAAVNGGFLQGLQRFAWLGGLGITGVAAKIAASVALIMACHAGVAGALGGVLAAAVLVWVCGGFVIMRSMPTGPIEPGGSAEPFPWRSLLPATVANVALATLTQIDMVLVNRYFDTGPASQYAAASILGKAVLYLPGGLVLALVPLVAEQHARRRDSRGVITQAALATLAMCGTGAVFYALCGPWLVRLLYGPGYAEAGSLLAWYGFAVLPMALVVVAENFLLAQGRTLFAWLFLVVGPIEVAIIHAWHPDLWTVIAIVGACSTVLAVIGYAILWRAMRPAEGR